MGTPSGKSVAASLGSQSQLESTLKAGLSVISQDQAITFRRYLKVVLPLDGYVFWVRDRLLSPSALLNTSPPNSSPFGAAPRVASTAEDLVVQGSLHISTENQQDADESSSTNRVVFTAKESVNDLNDIAPTEMWIATHGDYRFAFSSRRGYYRQADLYHYTGDAVYPVMEAQIIDGVEQLDTSLIVSNSLPIWLSMQLVMPVYPAFLVPDNLRPPYASVRVDPDTTQAIGMAPLLGPTSSHSQLVRERVHITVYGLRNASALDYLDYILAQSLGDRFGILNSPVPRDEHRTQTELSILAQKKSFDVEVNYYQSTARDIARQLILQAIPTFYIGGGVSPVPLPA